MCIAPLQENYSEVLSTPERSKRTVTNPNPNPNPKQLLGDIIHAAFFNIEHK